MKKVDDYVDSLGPEIQPRITSELEIFQQKTINSLETQVVDALRSLFSKDGDRPGADRNMNDTAPDAYGGLSLPFADEIAGLTRGFGKIADEAGNDLTEIFRITEGAEGQMQLTRGGGSGAREFFASALDAVQDRLDNDPDRGSGGSSGFQLDGLLGVISNTVKDASRNPEEKARLISPEIKEKVAAKLREQHALIAEQFTRIALEHIKRWLRGNTSTRDLGDGAKAEIEDQVKDLVKGLGGLFGSKRNENEGASRGVGDEGGQGGGGGFSRVISDKLSTGLARVHREVRLEFRMILGAIECQLFEMLPDAFQRPLEKILGGNPFDSALDRDAGSQTDRGFGDDIKAKLIGKLRDLVRKIQESLRESVLGVVNGGHRKFERESWVFVQDIVEKKVQRYLPDVKISVPDDIGNEGVSVLAPTAGRQPGSGLPADAPHAHQGYDRPPSGDQHGGQGYSQQEYRPPQHQEYRPEHREQYPGHQPERHEQQDYRPPQGLHQAPPPQNYSQQYQPPPQDHSRHGSPHGYPHDQGYQQQQNYGPREGYRRDEGNYRSDQGQGYGTGQWYQQGGGYTGDQGYRGDHGQDQGYGQHPQY